MNDRVRGGREADAAADSDVSQGDGATLRDGRKF